MAIPKGWNDSTIGSVLSSCTYGISCALSAEPYGVPILRMGNLLDERLSLSDLKYAPAEAVPSELLLRRGDVLFNRTNSNEHVGKVAYVDTDQLLGFASYLLRLRTIDTTDAQWLAHALASQQMRRALKSIATQGVSQANINPSRMRSLRLLVPPLPEQKKIAAVLSSVDAAIEKTEAVIAQLQVVKKAMMEQLLTKGLPGRHTRFKQTELGEIPEEWTIRRIVDLGLTGKQVVRSGPFGSSLKTKDFLDRGIPVLTIQSLGEGSILRDGLFFISKEKAEELREYKVLLNDLVFSRVADIGRCAAITSEETGWLISSNLTRVRLDPARALAKLIAQMLTMSPPVRRQIQMLTGSSGRPVISSSMLQQILIPLAPISEQLAISVRCDSIEQRISHENSTVNSLHHLKQALSSSLLSGELRVPTDSVPCPV